MNTLSGLSKPVVQSTAELLRVLALPRRAWSAAEIENMRITLEGFLRRPGSKARLQNLQAQALFELWYLPGIFCPMRVGSGKTLVSLLASQVVNASRPMLFVPAALVGKTKREAAVYAQDWRVPNHLRIESYEQLSLGPGFDTLLDKYQPDLLILDEGHWLKNRKAKRTKKVVRYLQSNLSARLVVLSGTITKRSILDFAHLLALSLRARACPIPTHFGELEAWSNALDEKPGYGPSLPGQLVHLCNVDELQEGHPSGTRKAFRRRLVDTHGVIASEETPVDASLVHQVVRPPVPKEVVSALQELRRTWTTPNGESFADGPTMWRHCRELALGFWYRWDPPAPQEWLDKRKAWASLCRGILASNQRRLDSEKDVANAVDSGHYPHAVKALEDWRAVKKTFTSNTVAEWISSYLVDWIHEETRAPAPPTIIWVDVVAFAKALSAKTGLVYYGRGGMSPNGRSIEQAPSDVSLIAGIESNKEGRNLQRFCRNLVVTIPPNNLRCEQVVGRTHRPFQEADEVHVRWVITCEEHEGALEQAWLDAKMNQDVTGVPQKLLMGDWI